MTAATAPDLMTLRHHFGALNGLKVAYVGDGDGFATALMEAGALNGMEVALATPADHRPDHDIVVEAEVTARFHGGSVDVGTDPAVALRGADVVYSDEPLSPGLRQLTAPDALFFPCHS